MNTANAELLLDSIEWKFERLRARLAAVEAERDAARAGEARAVEALKAAYDAAEEWHGSVEWEGREHAQAVIDACEAVLAAQRSAISWLAQQRREAAAEENDRWADDWWGRNGDCTASDFTARAAALRAGEVPHE